jgi:hypothetical protein
VIAGDDDGLNRVMAEAACAGHDPEVWFNVVAPAEAKRICNRCPVRELCLEIFDNEEYGIFGGMTPHERRERRWQERWLLDGAS